jgi:hypothetical protein
MSPHVNLSAYEHGQSCGLRREQLSCALWRRLIPKAGAGPALRSDGGREIDEYLMRLLRIGAASDFEARVYTEVLRGAD